MRDQKNIEEHLSRNLKKTVTVRLNKNNSTMLSILDNTPTSCRLSVHRRFLVAPREIVEAIGDFVAHKKGIPLILREYIQSDQGLETLSSRKASPLKTQGEVWNLEELLTRLEKELFDQRKLGLSITWYGKKKRPRAGVCKTLGMFDSLQKTVKIHRILDDPRVPEYYLLFVIYHEILHHLYPPKISTNGRIQYHHGEFKKHERRFPLYKEAIAWEETQSFWFESTADQSA